MPVRLALAERVNTDVLRFALGFFFASVRFLALAFVFLIAAIAGSFLRVKCRGNPHPRESLESHNHSIPRNSTRNVRVDPASRGQRDNLHK